MQTKDFQAAKRKVPGPIMGSKLDIDLVREFKFASQIAPTTSGQY